MEIPSEYYELDPKTDGRSTRSSHPPLITVGYDGDELLVTVRLSTVVVQMNPYNAADLKSIEPTAELSRSYSMGERCESAMRDSTIEAVEKTDTLPKRVAELNNLARWELERTIERALQPHLLNPPMGIR